MTGAITSSLSTTFQLPTHSNAQNANEIKLSVDAAAYVNFNGNASSTNGFLIPANTVVDFDPFLGDKVYAIVSGGATVDVPKNIYIAYFMNKHTDYGWR
jgi:hypothetical protein